MRGAAGSWCGSASTSGQPVARLPSHDECRMDVSPRSGGGHQQPASVAVNRLTGSRLVPTTAGRVADAAGAERLVAPGDVENRLGKRTRTDRPGMSDAIRAPIAYGMGYERPLAHAVRQESRASSQHAWLPVRTPRIARHSDRTWRRLPTPGVDGEARLRVTVLVINFGHVDAAVSAQH